MFVSQESVMKYLGPTASKWIAYPVASVSGTVLAVCSCTVLPLFAGIWTAGSRLGTGFSVPLFRTGDQRPGHHSYRSHLGAGNGDSPCCGRNIVQRDHRSLDAPHLPQGRRERTQRSYPCGNGGKMSLDGRPLWQTTVYFAFMVGVLVFANWGKPDIRYRALVHAFTRRSGSLRRCSPWVLQQSWFCGSRFLYGRWPFPAPWWQSLDGSFPHDPLVPFTVGVIALSVMATTSDGETQDWFNESWGFAKQILPLLFLGVLFAGLFLGRPDKEGLIPNAWIAWALGGNSVWSNAIASVAGAFMYFATLDRGADRSRAHRQRNGKRTCLGAAVGRSCSVVAEHAGHQQHHGFQEDFRVRVAWSVCCPQSRGCFSGRSSINSAGIAESRL